MFRGDEEIKHDMLNNVPDTLNKGQNSFIHDALAPASLEFVNLYMELDHVRKGFDVNNLEEDDLDRFIHQRTGIERREATHATTEVIISGEEGGVISKGDLVSTGKIDFESLENKEVSSTGFINVKVRSLEPGIAGNVSENSIDEFPSTINGLVDVYNPETIENGYEQEMDEELRDRYYSRLQSPGKAGNKYHYEQWATEVEGVGRAKVFPIWNGPLTVKVLIVDSDKQPAKKVLVESVEEYVKEEAPFGADVTIASAKPIEVVITVNLILDEEYRESTVIEGIESNIINYLKEIAFLRATVSYAIIGSLIIDSKGVKDYQNLRLNGNSTNIHVKEDEVAILGGVADE